MTGPKPSPPLLGGANLLAVTRARSQARLARTGHAVGQCPGCWSFRLDEKPPTVHKPWCREQEEMQGAEEEG